MAQGTLCISAEYSKNNPPSTPHNGHTMKDRPDPAAIKRGKTVKVDGAIEEVNNIASHDAPISIKNKGIINMTPPKNTKEVCVFIGIVY